jgi:alpha-tubulin suppressor-like RCC1 family protein
VLLFVFGSGSAATAPHRSIFGLGDTHSCVLGTKGAVRCFGYNGYGESGHRDHKRPWAQIRTVIESGAVAVTAGRNHSCAILSTGAVNCWGRARDGELGNGGTASHSRPVPVRGLDGEGGAAHQAVTLDAGANFTCAVTAAGGVECWGAGSHGPMDVPRLAADVVDISSSASFACAVTSAGAVLCWGDDGYGQIGDGVLPPGGYRVTPSPVVGLQSGVRQVAVGSFHACALTNAGAVKCWGSNAHGNLGDGSLADISSRPVAVVGLERGVHQIAAGGDHTCALLNSGAFAAGVMGRTANWVTAGSPPGKTPRLHRAV